MERERERDKEQRKLYLASLLAMEESLICFTCFTSTKVRALLRKLYLASLLAMEESLVLVKQVLWY